MPKLNPVKELLGGASYCEDTSVNKTRKDKSCDLCNNSIPKGSAHIGAKLFCDEYYPVNFCNDCKMDYSYQLSQMRQGKYDEL